MYAGILPSLMDIQEGTRAKRPPEGALDAHQQQKPRRSRAKGQGKGQITRTAGHHQQLQAVARLLLRHDAQLNRLAQDTTVLSTFTNKPLQPEAILPHLYQISAEWKKRMESSQKPSMSLRVTIFQALLLELKSRLQKIVGSEENKAVLVGKVTSIPRTTGCSCAGSPVQRVSSRCRIAACPTAVSWNTSRSWRKSPWWKATFCDSRPIGRSS